MQREHPKQPLIGVGALIVENGRIVLIKRGKAPLLGEWSIPGGMLELGETLRQGAEREALEETGLVVRATELLGVFDRVVPDTDGNIVPAVAQRIWRYSLLSWPGSRVTSACHD